MRVVIRYFCGVQNRHLCCLNSWNLLLVPLLGLLLLFELVDCFLCMDSQWLMPSLVLDEATKTKERLFQVPNAEFAERIIVSKISRKTSDHKPQWCLHVGWYRTGGFWMSSQTKTNCTFSQSWCIQEACHNERVSTAAQDQYLQCVAGPEDHCMFLATFQPWV